jgi:hypothetical protein
MEVLFAPTVYQAKNSSDVPMSFFACLKLHRMCVGLMGCDQGGRFKDSEGEGWAQHHSRWGR